jgi:hypothetical protein
MSARFLTHPDSRAALDSTHEVLVDRLFYLARRIIAAGVSAANPFVQAKKQAR